MTTNLVDRDNAVDGDTAPATAPVDVAGTPSGTAEQDIYPYVLRGVDPRQLRTGGNSRVVGDIRQRRPELVASVAEHGVDPKISIINVVLDPDDGVPEVLVGFHRTAAAVAVKELENPDLTVSLLVHAPGTSRKDVLVAQGIENIHRQGYTQAEEAGLYAQLALAGFDDDEQIARALTRPVERVRAGRAIAAAPRTRAASEELPDLDLLELGQLLEFADNERDHAEMTAFLAHNPHNFEWKADQVRKRRQRRAMQAEQAERFAEQGYALIEDEQNPPEGTVRLDELCNGDDPAPLEPAAHAECPGRAVAVEVDHWMEVQVTEFCTDHAAHGHHTIVSVKTAAAQDQLRAQGVVITDPDAEGVAALDDLFADEQAEHTVTAEEHAGCPGHAAYVQGDPYTLTVDIVYVCTDPAAHGHVQRASLAKPERDAAFKAAEVKRAGVNNKLWREAKAARRDWLAKFFTGWRRKKPADLPPRIHHWLALAPVLAADFVEEAAPAHRYACTLLKIGEPEGRKREANPLVAQLRKKATTETQAVLIRLAQVLGACEEHWDRAYTDKSADASWRRPSDDARFYFELLDALGYPLEHVEQLINNPDLDNDRWPHLAPDTAAADDSDTPDDADSEEDDTAAA
ncbi:hypothetical protein [Amycolatopsis magusensis]|uniref:hypothetical protein n=1 Tax=Amycolatopsis magusensis TaxID=882444 RepID=UPI00379FA975